MNTKQIDGWLCVDTEGMRVASRGAESASYEPGGSLVVTCDSSGLVSLSSAVLSHLLGEATSVAADAREAFHNHLDGCTRCASQPFNLCDIGAALLPAAAQKGSSRS